MVLYNYFEKNNFALSIKLLIYAYDAASDKK